MVLFWPPLVPWGSIQFWCFVMLYALLILVLAIVLLDRKVLGMSGSNQFWRNVAGSVLTVVVFGGSHGGCGEVL
jgi:hypothetical protein